VVLGVDEVVTHIKVTPSDNSYEEKMLTENQRFSRKNFMTVKA